MYYSAFPLVATIHEIHIQMRMGLIGLMFWEGQFRVPKPNHHGGNGWCSKVAYFVGSQAGNSTRWEARQRP